MGILLQMWKEMGIKKKQKATLAVPTNLVYYRRKSCTYLLTINKYS